MKYCTSLHFKTHSLLSKKKSLRGKTAANNGQKKKLALKITGTMQTGKTGPSFKGPLTYRVFCALKFVISNVDARYARS